MYIIYYNKGGGKLLKKRKDKKMKIGCRETTTTIIRNSNIGKDYMLDCCDGYEPLYRAWCAEIDSALDGSGFWHEPACSEVCGPIDSAMEMDEFQEIMDAAYKRACDRVNAENKEA